MSAFFAQGFEFKKLEVIDFRVSSRSRTKIYSIKVGSPFSEPEAQPIPLRTILELI